MRVYQITVLAHLGLPSYMSQSEHISLPLDMVSTTAQMIGIKELYPWIDW